MGDAPSHADPSRAEAEPKRSFSVTVETRSGNIRSMIDDERAVVIHADPLTRKTTTGSRVSMGFPVLVVSGWVADAEEFARKVAALLEEAQP